MCFQELLHNTKCNHNKKISFFVVVINKMFFPVDFSVKKFFTLIILYIITKTLKLIIYHCFAYIETIFNLKLL